MKAQFVIPDNILDKKLLSLSEVNLESQKRKTTLFMKRFVKFYAKYFESSKNSLKINDLIDN